MHLPPAIYDALQTFVNGDHTDTYNRLLAAFQGIRPGDMVLEIGCGTGLIGRHFASNGYQYWGIDVSAERVDKARETVHGGHFAVGDVLDMRWEELPRCRYAFTYGVLHHLSDDQCERLIGRIFAAWEDLVFAVIESSRPPHWWRDPVATFLANMDEGKYIRKADE